MACVLSAAVACGSFFGGCGRCLVADGSNARTGGGTRRRVATERAEGRQRSRPLSNVGRLPLLLKRSEAADCIAGHLSRGGGTTPTPGTLPAVRLSSSPFKRSLLRIHKTITKQTQFQQSLKGAAEYIYNLHARRIYNILHERAIIILSYTHTPARPCLFFSFFFFFLFLFFFYLFFYLFFYFPFLFVFFFAFFRFSFLFLLYYFSFLFAFRLFRFAFRFSFLFFLFFSTSIFATVPAAARG